MAARPLPPLPAGRVCTLTDKIIVVGPTRVSVYSPTHVLLARGRVSHHEHLGDRCGADGFAGCSVTFDRSWSPAIPGHFIEFGTNAGNVLFADDESSGEDCAEQ